MTLEQLRTLFRDVAGFSINEWDHLYSFVQAWKPERCLDIGFGNGVSTVCIATAMREIGSACVITAVDNGASWKYSPNINDLQQRAGLDQATISVSASPSHANWAFIELLEREDECRYDLIHIDGERSWHSMGFAVALAQRLMNRNGWLVINGADFEYASLRTENREWLTRMPLAEKMTCQVNKIFELLICGDPRFDVCRRQGTRFFARMGGLPSREVSGEEERARKIELSDILHRAQHDPDYRFNLIWNPEEILSTQKSVKNPLLIGTLFVEKGDEVVLGREYDEERRSYSLGVPSWRSLLSREDLEQMIGSGMMVEGQQEEPQ